MFVELKEDRNTGSKEVNVGQFLITCSCIIIEEMEFLYIYNNNNNNNFNSTSAVSLEAVPAI